MNAKLSAGAFVVSMTLLLPHGAAAQGAKLRLDHLNRLAEKAAEVVDISIDSAMLKQAAGFLAGKDADAARLHELIQGITGIYIKSFEFNAANDYSPQDVEEIRKQVAVPGWSRMVGVREKDEISEIHVWTERGVSGGLVVISAEARELTVVNIVGRVDLASLAALGPIIPKLPATRPPQ